MEEEEVLDEIWGYGPKAVKQIERYNSTLFDDLAREKKAI